MVNKYLLNYEEKKLPCFILFDLESQEFVGRCGFSFYEAGELEVNYIFHKKFWGRGYASEALSALITWAKKSIINVNHIIGYAPLSHHASIRVMEKCGMEYFKNDIDPIDNIECCFYRINNMKTTIEKISADHAEQLCRQITANLPEYFGLPECNEHYALGIHTRTNFAIKVDNEYIGLLSLDFPYPQNSNIYWMGLLRQHQGHGYGQLLVEFAIDEAKKQGARTMTVETLSPAESDQNYLKTYRFYEDLGFMPLFNLKPDGYAWNMVYMCLLFI